MKDKLLSVLKYVIGWPLSLLAFGFIIKILIDQAPTLLPHLEHIDWFVLSLGTLCLMLYYFCRSLIWYYLMRGFSHSIPYRESSYLWSMSEMRRYIPGKVWLVLGRATMFGKHGVDKKEIGKSLIFEMELFVLGCLVVSLLAVPFLFPQIPVVVFMLIGVTVLAIIGIYAFNQHLLRTTVFKKINISNNKLKSAISYLLPTFPAKESLRLTAISAVGLFFFGLGNYLVITAIFLLNPQVVFQLIGIFVLAFLTGFLSFIAPSGLGVREGVVLYSLMQVTTAGLAAFAAVFSRVILVVAEILFILCSYVLKTTKSRWILRSIRWVHQHPQISIVAVLSLVFAIYLTAASFLRYEHYYTGRFDLGNMAQTVWNSMHGRWFLFTNPDSTEIVSRLAFHADFILIMLAPFYALWQDPRMLLLIQAVVTAAGAFFVYAIVREVLKSKNLGVIFAFAYLINPSVQRVVLYDFHAVALATTFFLGAFYFLLKKRWLWMTVFLFFAASTKEHIWLIVSLFGLVVLVGYRKYLLGTLLTLSGFGIFYYLVSYAIPQAASGVEHFALEYFAAFGSTPKEVLLTILLSPQTVLQTIWTPTRIDYFEQIFSPFGYLSFLFPFPLIFAGPDLGINLLSNNEQLHQIWYQYTATITPFILLSAVYGIWVIQKGVLFLQRKHKGKINTARSTYLLSVLLGAYVLSASIYAAYMFGPLPGARWENIHMFTKPLPNKAFVDAYIDRIPQSYRVTASNSLGSHLTHRDYLYAVPYGIDQADLVVLQIDDQKSQETLENLQKDPRFVQDAHNGNFYAFKRVGK